MSSICNRKAAKILAIDLLQFASYFYDSIHISHPGSINEVVCLYCRSPCYYNTFWDQSTKVVSGTQACSPPFKWCLRPTDGAKWCEIDKKWKSLWISLPKTLKASIELLKCGCKQGCSGIRQSQSALYKRFVKNTSNSCRVPVCKAYFYDLTCAKPSPGKPKWTQKYYLSFTHWVH